MHNKYSHIFYNKYIEFVHPHLIYKIQYDQEVLSNLKRLLGHTALTFIHTHTYVFLQVDKILIKTIT